MMHVFKKVNLMLTALIGIQAFGSQNISKDAKLAVSAGAIGLLTGPALYSMALDTSIRAKPYSPPFKPVHVSRTTRFLMRTWPYSAGMAAGALATTALGLKYYNNKFLTPERSRAFKERTPVYNYYTLGDSY